MSFDQNMIIDATKGSIARFVNHSCKPNCRMVKWIVGGKPRMALFAGDFPVTTGAELTYDYKFDPFSLKNIQECRCGSENCRGVLGPRPKDDKPVKQSVKEVVKKSVKSSVKAGKRKLKELLEDDLDEADSNESGHVPKRMKIKHIKEAKKMKSLSSKADVKVAKRSKTTAGSNKSVSKRLQKMGEAVGAQKGQKSQKGRGIAVKKTSKSSASVLKTYGKGLSWKRQTKLSMTNSTLTIVVADDDISTENAKKELYNVAEEENREVFLE